MDRESFFTYLDHRIFRLFIAVRKLNVCRDIKFFYKPWSKACIHTTEYGCLILFRQY